MSARFVPWAALAGLAVVVASTPARAQTGSASANLTIQSVTGRSGTAVTNLITNPVNAEECAEGDAFTISLRITNIPTTKTLLDFWRGPKDTNCADSSNRDTTQGGSPVCTHLSLGIDTAIAQNSIREMTLPLPTLLDKTGDGMCDGDDDGAYSIHILAVDSAGTKEEVGASWSFTVQLDTKAPNAPTSLSGGQGDTQISVSWSRPDDNLREQKVYVALGACTGGIFDGNADAGDSADGGDGTAWKRAETVENSVNSVTLSGSSIGLSLGEEAAVSVTAIDLAGNESAFSEPACIQRVKTDGFCERLAADGGKCESCTVRTPGRSQGLPIVLVAATAFALATWRRRR